MDDGPVTYMTIRTQQSRLVGPDVEHAILLDVGSGAYDDVPPVSTQHRSRAYVAAFANRDPTYDRRLRMHKGAIRHRRSLALEFPEAHHIPSQE
jgi:hypothetical protein